MLFDSNKIEAEKLQKKMICKAESKICKGVKTTSTKRI